MAKNAMTIFDDNKLQLPSHLQDTFGDEKNIVDRVTVPSLSYGGKVWTIHNNGEKTKITKKDDDGDEIPVNVMKVVVLDYAKRRGRAYYEGAYDPDKPGAPLCWSDDGITPHESVKEPQCSRCDKCPMAAKGSKVTESGKSVTACSQHRMLVVVPAGKLDYTPLRLKLAITSDWDKQSPEMEKLGWFAFNNFTDFLRTKNVPHTAAVITKMKFDPNTDYPKVMFSPDRWLTKEEAEVVKPVIKSEAVQSLLNSTWSPAGVDGVKVAEDDEDEKPKAKKAAPKKAAAVEDDEDEDDTPPPPPKGKKKAVIEDDEDDTPPPPPKAKAKAKAPVEDDDEDDTPPPPKTKAKAKAPVEDDDDDVEIIPPSKGKAQTKAKVKAVEVDDDDEPAPKPKKGKAKEAVGDVPEDVADLLDDWDTE